MGREAGCETIQALAAWKEGEGLVRRCRVAALRKILWNLEVTQRRLSGQRVMSLNPRRGSGRRRSVLWGLEPGWGEIYEGIQVVNRREARGVPPSTLAGSSLGAILEWIVKLSGHLVGRCHGLLKARGLMGAT